MENQTLPLITGAIVRCVDAIEYAGYADDMGVPANPWPETLQTTLGNGRDLIKGEIAEFGSESDWSRPYTTCTYTQPRSKLRLVLQSNTGFKPNPRSMLKVR